LSSEYCFENKQYLSTTAEQQYQNEQQISKYDGSGITLVVLLQQTFQLFHIGTTE